MIILEGYLEYLIAAEYQLLTPQVANQTLGKIFIIFVMFMCFVVAISAFIYNIANNITIYQLSKFNS